MDGIDAAVLRTDGLRTGETLHTLHVPYDDDLRGLLRAALREARALTERAARPGVLKEAEAALTEAHIAAVEKLRADHDGDIDLIGFHGHTVLHRPEERLTVQIGDARALAAATGIDVMHDLRAHDVAHGGQGAPLTPAWHRLLADRAPARPVVFVNIGGVANLTHVGGQGELMAFDTGPGNALIDDFMRARTGEPFDEDGRMALSGTVDEEALRRLQAHPFFHARPPKSLDRNAFDLSAVEHLSTEDGAATLTAFTVCSITHAAEWLPQPPQWWIVTGGGRRNRAIMTWLAEKVEAPVAPAEALQCDGDMMEAEAWAYLAVRAVKGLLISWPQTTGAPEPLSGGVLVRAEEAREYPGK